MMRNKIDCTRRRMLLGVSGHWALGAQAAKTPKAAPHRQRKPATVLVMGDSLSAEYGLPRGAGWVNLMRHRLSERGMQATVINASISGETTAGGRTRLAALLAQHHPTHVVIELGANDALRGLPLKNSRANLLAMIKACQQAGAAVVLVGMMVPPNYGRRYTADFAAMFSGLAQDQGTALVPFLLKGVADRPDAQDWFQPDRIHPLAKGHPIMMEQVWKALAPLL